MTILHVTLIFPTKTTSKQNKAATMTATTAIKPKNSFAKNMESHTKRLIQQQHLKQPSSLLRRKMRQASSPALPSGSRCDHHNHDNMVVANSTSTAPTTPFLPRLCEETTTGEKDDEELFVRHRWRSPIGTIADHRMTNNNRIHKQWHIFAVICFSLLLWTVQVTVVNGHPDPAPTPIRVSHSYTKTVSNTVPTSSTSRSTTQITSFLPSDAISSLSSAVINYKNHNAFASSNRSSSSGTSSFSSNMFSFKPMNASSDNNSNNNNKNNNNANIQSSSRRLASAKHTDRMDFSHSPVTSIDRPFYTKLTSNDAVSSPSYYKRTKSASKKPKKSKNSSKASSSPYSKYSKGKGSKEHHYSSSSMSAEDIDLDNEYSFMPHTTEKSYHPPKLSLEPFFNFLTSLATASREVIMSKEQQHNSNHHPTVQSFTTGASSNGKYSPSYETVNQPEREGAKKSKKSKKGGTKGKKKSKGHGKGSKKGGKGGGKHHHHHHPTKSAESLEEEEEEFDLEETPHGPIPIQLPDPIIESAEEDAKETDNSSEGIENSGGLHILDVLRTPMIPDYESPPSPAVRAEPLVALEYHHDGSSSSSSSNNGGSSHNNDGTNVPSNASSSAFSPSNPPSGRANMNKGQGYLAFDNYEGSNVNGSMIHKQQREKQRKERDPMDSFHDQHAGVDLHAQESISHAHVLPSPFGMKNNAAGGLAPTQYQHQQQHLNANNEVSSASVLQQVSPPQTNTPEILPSGTSETSHANGKSDFVSKYPTTFVYQPGSASGHSPPGSHPYVNPSPPGYPQNNAVIYGSPPPTPSGRPPFRMNKLRPNLHSYYDSSYHNYAGMGESLAASEMIGVRQPFGPPHFKPPPHALHSPFPLPPPPRFANGYGNRPGFMMMPHRGTHYVGNTFNAASSHKEPNVKPYEDTNPDYQQDVTGNDNGNNNNNNHEDSSVGHQGISGADATGSAADNIDQYTVSEVDENSVHAAENSETKKVGIMDSFDVFYKEYKILTWVAVFFVTSMALLTLLVYLYINNPPTEVVQARQLLPWNDLLKNPQITRFLSSLTKGSGTSKRKRKKDDPAATSAAVDDDDNGYLKPYGFGFGGKSGKQKRKETRRQQDKNKFTERANKIKQLSESGSSSSGGVSTGSVPATPVVGSTSKL